MKHFRFIAAALALLLSHCEIPLYADQAVYVDGTGKIVSPPTIIVGAGTTLDLSGGTIVLPANAVLTSGDQTITGTKNFTGTLEVGGIPLGAPTWSSITGTPTTLAGYGVTSVAWSLLTATPTTLSGYGITSVPWSVLTGTPTTLAAYGITDAVSNTITINGHATTGNVTITKGDVGLGNAENTALSTWTGSSNIANVGALQSGSIGSGFSLINWNKLTGTPTTLSGYGITDAVSNTITINGHATTGNVTIGLSDIITLPADATKFLNGTGAFTTPSGGGGGGVTHYQVPDTTTRFSGSYHDGDLVTETGQPTIFTIQVGADSSGSADLAYAAFLDSGGNVIAPWLDINADGPPSWGFSATYPIQVNSSQNDSAATIGANLLAALNGNGAFSSQFTASFDGIDTVTITTKWNFPASFLSETQWNFQHTQDGAIPTNTFLVIDSTQSSGETGFAPVHSANEWVQIGLSGGTFSAYGPYSNGAIVQMLSQGNAGSNAGALSYSVSNGTLTITSSNPADSSQVLVLIEHY